MNLKAMEDSEEGLEAVGADVVAEEAEEEAVEEKVMKEE